MATTLSGANVKRVDPPGHQFGTGQNRGLYATACEDSPNRQQIDMWLNEGKPCAWISKELAKLGEKISDKSVAKYKDYRDTYIQDQLAKDPVVQATVQTLNQTMIDTTAKIKEIDVLQHLSNTIDQSAKLIAKAMEEDEEGNPQIKIRNATDLRMVQMTLLDCIRLYGDTVLKIQKFTKVEDNPELLRPGNNDELKQVISAILQELPPDVRFNVIDRLRGGSAVPGIG